MEKNYLEDTIYLLEDFYGNSFDIKSGDEIEKIIRGKYFIKKLLSESSYSKLYLVEYENKDYVCKIMLEENFYPYLENEYKILRDFSHPNIIQAINYYEANRVEPPILLLEYLEGSKLFDFKDRSLIEKIKISLDLIKIYYDLECLKLIHGDIKSDNIIIDKEARIKLIDFGLGNKYNLPKGSIKYMSPETLLSNIKDLKSEIYSLALNIFELIYFYPFNELDIKNSIENDKIPLQSDIYLSLILTKATLRDRNLRYSSFYDFLKELEKYYFLLRLSNEEEFISKEKFSTLFSKEFPNYLFNEFYYDFYSSKKNIKNNLDNFSKLDFLIDLYIPYENYRISPSIDIFFKELSEIYVINDLEKLRQYIVNKINYKLNLLDFSIEMNKGKDLEKQMLFHDLLKLYKEISRKGSREAEYNLALMYKEGKKVDKNLEKAFLHFYNLAEIEYTQGIYQLAQLYQKGLACNKDLKKAREYLEKGAKLGHLGCQNSLGIAYRYAYGVEKNLEKACYWYEKAARGGHIAAQNNIGFMYKNGLGVEQNYEEACNWYRLSSKSGNSSAQVNLAFMYKNALGVNKDLKEAFYWYKKASEQGNISAQVNLGRFYQEGWTVEKDYKLALKLYNAGVKVGNEQALTYFAYLLQNGLGIDKDEGKAKLLYEKAIQNGFSLAQYYYGKFLIEGSIKDYEQGIKYLKKAAKQKNIDAQLYLAKLYIEGKFVKKSFEIGKKYYEIAGEEGSTEAFYELGKIYFDGKEVLQNFKKAYGYVYKSAKQGYPPAQLLLGNFYEHGYGIKKDLEEALIWKNLSGELDAEKLNSSNSSLEEKSEIKEDTVSTEDLINENEIHKSDFIQEQKKKIIFFKKKWFNK